MRTKERKHLGRGTYQIEVRTCGQCGKKFVPAAFHIYRQDSRTFCNWSCLARYREEKEEPK